MPKERASAHRCIREGHSVVNPGDFKFPYGITVWYCSENGVWEMSLVTEVIYILKEDF